MYWVWFPISWFYDVSNRLKALETQWKGVTKMTQEIRDIATSVQNAATAMQRAAQDMSEAADKILNTQGLSQEDKDTLTTAKQALDTGAENMGSAADALEAILHPE